MRQCYLLYQFNRYYQCVVVLLRGLASTRLIQSPSLPSHSPSSWAVCCTWPWQPHALWGGRSGHELRRSATVLCQLQNHIKFEKPIHTIRGDTKYFSQCAYLWEVKYRFSVKNHDKSQNQNQSHTDYIQNEWKQLADEQVFVSTCKILLSELDHGKDHPVSHLSGQLGV